MGQPQRTNGMAIAGLVVGIISLILWWIPFFGLVPPIVGIILSNLGRRAATGRTMAIVGLVLSIIALVLALIIVVLFFIGLLASRNTNP